MCLLLGPWHVQCLETYYLIGTREYLQEQKYGRGLHIWIDFWRTEGWLFYMHSHYWRVRLLMWWRKLGLVLWAPKISIVSLGLLWSNVENPDIIPIKTFLLGKEGKSLDELSYHTLFYAMEVVGLGLMAPTRKTVFLHWAEILCIQKTLTLLWDGWLRKLPRFSLPCF